MKTILLFLILGWIVPFLDLKNPPVTSVSFQLIRNLILVKGSVNGKEGLFILDTGASEVILNRRFFNGIPSRTALYSVHGNEIENQIVSIKFSLGGFEKKVLANVTDFTALEKSIGLELFGVVGNSLFENSELVLDYTFKELTIYLLDKDGNRLSPKSIHQQHQVTLPFFARKGIPFIVVNANGKLLKMILDSGASANVMDTGEINRLNSGSLSLKTDSVASLGQEIVLVKSSKVDELRVGNLTCPPMKTLFVSLNQLNQNHWGIKVDGILGYEFLSNFRVAINFRKREIYLWDRKSVELQWAIANNRKAY